jgi:hypothetical protein
MNALVATSAPEKTKRNDNSGSNEQQKKRLLRDGLARQFRHPFLDGF